MLLIEHNQERLPEESLLAFAWLHIVACRQFGLIPRIPFEVRGPADRRAACISGSTRVCTSRVAASPATAAITGSAIMAIPTLAVVVGRGRGQRP